MQQMGTTSNRLLGATCLRLELVSPRHTQSLDRARSTPSVAASQGVRTGGLVRSTRQSF